MKIDLASIQKQLRKFNVILDKNSLRLHHKQGVVNEVYTVESNKGKLLICFGKNPNDHTQLKRIKKAYFLVKLLTKYPKIPTAIVFTYGKDSYGNVFFVQKFIDGNQLALKGKYNKIHLKKLAKILMHLHQINIAGAGYIIFRNGKLRGTHKNWHGFLKNNSFKCLRNIYSAQKNTGPLSRKKYSQLKFKLRIFFKKYKEYFVQVKGKLLHGDVDFPNIIVDNKKIAALVDFEWALAGDPAWDFAGRDFLDNVLEKYFLELRKTDLFVNSDDFKFKMKLYRAIKLLFIANIFRENESYNWIMEEFEKRLNKFL